MTVLWIASTFLCHTTFSPPENGSAQPLGQAASVSGCDSGRHRVQVSVDTWRQLAKPAVQVAVCGSLFYMDKSKAELLFSRLRTIWYGVLLSDTQVWNIRHAHHDAKRKALGLQRLASLAPSLCWTALWLISSAFINSHHNRESYCCLYQSFSFSPFFCYYQL